MERYIYIFTNQSFPDYVKIGYTKNIEKRLEDLNRTPCTPFVFRLYAYYETNEELDDILIHDMIDRINPTLRSVDTFKGKPRKREFFKMSKETAYNILYCAAKISGTFDRLHLADEENEIIDDEEAKAVDSTKYDIPTFLSNKNIKFINLHNEIVSEVKKTLNNVYEEATPNYLALRNEKGKNICEFHFHKTCFRIYTRKPISEELQIGETMPYSWTLNYKINIDKSEQVQLISRILIEVYNQIK